MSDPITFYATVAKIQTLADGGIRATLDLPESAIMPAAELMACKRAGVVLDVVVTIRPGDDDGTESGNRKIHI